MITKFDKFDEDSYIGMWFIDSDVVYLIDRVDSIPEKHHEVITYFGIHRDDGSLKEGMELKLYAPILDDEYFVTTQQAYDKFPNAFTNAYNTIISNIDFYSSNTFNPSYLVFIEKVKSNLENGCEEINMLSQTNKYNI